MHTDLLYVLPAQTQELCNIHALGSTIVSPSSAPPDLYRRMIDSARQILPDSMYSTRSYPYWNKAISHLPHNNSPICPSLDCSFHCSQFGFPVRSYLICKSSVRGAGDYSAEKKTNRWRQPQEPRHQSSSFEWYLALNQLVAALLAVIDSTERSGRGGWVPNEFTHIVLASKPSPPRWRFIRHSEILLNAVGTAGRF
jgi:hypothetical protein